MANAQQALAGSDAALAANQVALFRALGGGWENTHAAHGGHGAASGHGEQKAQAVHPGRKEHKAGDGAHYQ